MPDTPSIETAVPPNQVGRVQNNGGATGAGWLPGQSGNPGGRPKGVAAYVRSLSLDGVTLIDKVWDILQNPTGKPYQRQKLQLECIQLLMDRGWGKAVQNVEHSGAIIHAWDVFKDMTTDDLQALVQAGRALNEARANAIEGEARVEEESEDVGSSQSGEVS